MRTGTAPPRRGGGGARGRVAELEERVLDYSVPTALIGAAFGSAILAAFLFYLSRLGGAHLALGWWSGALTFNVARYLLLLEASLPPGERPALMVVGAAHLADVALAGMVGCLIAGSFVFF